MSPTSCRIKLLRNLAAAIPTWASAHPLPLATRASPACPAPPRSGPRRNHLGLLPPPQQAHTRTAAAQLAHAARASQTLAQACVSMCARATRIPCRPWNPSRRLYKRLQAIAVIPLCLSLATSLLPARLPLPSALPRYAKPPGADGALPASPWPDIAMPPAPADSAPARRHSLTGSPGARSACRDAGTRCANLTADVPELAT